MFSFRGIKPPNPHQVSTCEFHWGIRPRPPSSPTDNFWICQCNRTHWLSVGGSTGKVWMWKVSLQVAFEHRPVNRNSSVNSVFLSVMTFYFVNCWRSWREAATSVGRRCQWSAAQRRGNWPVQVGSLHCRTVRQRRTVWTEEARQWTDRLDFELALCNITALLFIYLSIRCWRRDYG